MLNKYTNRLLTLIMVCCLTSSISFAQFWTETFDGSLNGWTTVDNSIGQSGDAWIHTTEGPTGTYTTGPMESTTADNGWAVFDSDLLCSGSQNAWLISPSIDCSTRSNVSLSFESYYRQFVGTVTVLVSNDGGMNWGFLDLHTTLAGNEFSDNPETITVGLSDFADGEANVQIAFQYLSESSEVDYGGCGYSWQLDDIALSELAGVDFFLFSYEPHSQLSASQVPDAGLDMTGQIVNVGLAEDVASLTVNVYDDTNTLLYTGTSDTVTVDTNSLAVVSAGLWTGATEGSTYTLEYIVNTPTGTDDTPANNNFSKTLTISAATSAIDNATSNSDISFIGGLVGGGEVVYQGNSFPIYKDDVLSGISSYLRGNAGGTFAIEAYLVESGVPGDTPIATTGQITLANNLTGWWDGSFTSPLDVTAGETILIVQVFDPAGIETVELGVTDYYVPQTAWIRSGNITGDVWANMEQLQFTTGEAITRSFALRANFGTVTSDVTVTVDMREQTIATEGAYIAGTFNNWVPEVMTYLGDSLWTFSTTAPSGSTLEYNFLNGPTAFEDNTGLEACGVADPMGGFYRSVSVGFIAIDVLPVCFASCEICTPPPADPCADPDAIICDNFDSYTLSNISPQATHWTPWDDEANGAFDVPVSDEMAFSGSNSLKIRDNGSDDMLLLLGLQDSGSFELSWNMYIPVGSNAYFNVQRNNSAGTETGDWLDEIYLGYDGQGGDATPGQGTFLNAGTNFDYPEDAWFPVLLRLFTDEDIILVYINDVYAGTIALPTTFGAINFFSATDINNYYIDDVLFKTILNPANDFCPAAMDINGLFGQGQGVANVTSLQDNTNATTEDSDPVDGIDCFAEPNYNLDTILQSTQWFTFVGDGQTYHLETMLCDATDPIGDTQIAVYSGNCGDFTSIVCNDDIDIGSGMFLSEADVETEEGVVYYVMIDGFGDATGIGEYCLEVTQLTSTQATVTLTVDMSLETVDPSGVRVSGTFNDWGAFVDMTDNGDNTWSYVASVDRNTQLRYIFQNGSTIEAPDNLTDCGVQDPALGDLVRSFEVGDENAVLPTVCFEYCIACVDVAVTETEFNTGIQIVPNPATDLATIQYNFSEVLDLNISIYNNLGQLVFDNVEKGVQSGNINVDVSKFAAGLYFVNITDGSNQLNKRLIIQN